MSDPALISQTGIIRVYHRDSGLYPKPPAIKPVPHDRSAFRKCVRQIPCLLYVFPQMIQFNPAILEEFDQLPVSHPDRGSWRSALIPILTHRTNDYHTDHRNTGLLVQDTAYLLMVPNVCPDTPALDYAPVMMYVSDDFRKPAPFEPAVVVDIDDVIIDKVRMADCHKSQFYEWLPWIGRYADSIPEGTEERFRWLTGQIEQLDSLTAKRFQTEIADRYGNERASRIHCIEAFERSEYGGVLTDEMIPVYFPF